jgi:hypothetical protein
MAIQDMSTDWCVNCEDVKEFATYVHMEFPNGHYRFGPICKDCYSANNPGPRAMIHSPYSKSY